MSYEQQAGMAYELELARKRIAELEGARAKQAAELERLRTFVNLARLANDEPYMAETGYKLRRAFEFIDAPAVAQAEAQAPLPHVGDPWDCNPAAQPSGEGAG